MEISQEGSVSQPRSLVPSWKHKFTPTAGNQPQGPPMDKVTPFEDSTSENGGCQQATERCLIWSVSQYILKTFFCVRPWISQL